MGILPIRMSKGGTGMVVLVVDIGGTNVKVRVGARGTPVKIPSQGKMTARRMVDDVREAVASTPYDVVSIGYPGVVQKGKPIEEPKNLPAGWVGFDYRRAFKRPVRIINDAAMQALGGYQGGRMLFLGLGTGMGSALVVHGVLQPLQLAHLPYKKGDTYEECVGKAALARLGKKKWRQNVFDVIARFTDAFLVDEVVLGGGNAKLLKTLPEGVRQETNVQAFIGGERLWDERFWTPATPSKR